MNPIRACSFISVALLQVLLGLTSSSARGQEDPPAISSYKVLHSFAQADENGFYPIAALVQGVDGNFYGTNSLSESGGTVFKMTPSGKVTLLHSFTGIDGRAPSTAMVIGTDGLLYGQTALEGGYGGGTAFKITTKGMFTLLHSFVAVTEGQAAYFGALTLGPDGNFYGATEQGGTDNFGTAFKMTASGGVTVLHTFSGGVTDGGSVRGELSSASDGNFYGTTICGGANVPPQGCGGGGTVYQLTPSGQLTSLVNYGNSSSVPESPQAAPLDGNDGFLYGTTSEGSSNGRNNFGTVYRMSLDGQTYVTLHNFAGGLLGVPKNNDGAYPAARLLHAGDGNFYGTTPQGGSHEPTSGGDGILFKITSAGVFTVLHEFGANAQDGARPYAALIQGSDGYLYGTTSLGGVNGLGTVFRFQP
jgi:uncharacterized repeat protein (TIGR03803 family)